MTRTVHSASARLVMAAVLMLAAACGGGGAEVVEGPVEIDIAISDTGVDAPQRPRIALGSEVSIRFTSDQADDAHLHGYDLWSSVGPDAENRIDFVADQPGIFLLELERELLYLTELVVQ